MMSEGDSETLRAGLTILTRPAQYSNFENWIDICNIVADLQEHSDLDVRYAAELAYEEVHAVAVLELNNSDSLVSATHELQ